MKILGVHPASHDTSACLVEDGQVTYAAAEERISRTCHDGRFPEKVIGNALEYAGLQAGQIDAAAISWSPPLKSAMYTLIDAVRDATGPMSAARFGKSAFSRVWSQGGARALERIFGIKKIYFCDHHLAHAISAFSYSGFKEAAVVVIDGRGAFEASSIWLGRDGQLTPIEIIRWPNSLGLFYAKFTTYLGFKALSDEWKVMGLAAFGQPGVDLSSFISHDEEPYKVHTTRLSATSLVDVSDIERVMGPKRQDHQPIEQRHKDIAYAVQKHCERAMLDTVHYAIRKTGLHSVCLAGGVAMNCKANGLVANDPEVERIFVQPASADDGTALGAALYPYLMTEGRLPTVPMQHPYFGDQYTAEEIEASLQKYKLGYERMNNRAETIAQLLADGNIIGHFNNRMEFGARALGNRSIIADPRKCRIK